MITKRQAILATLLYADIFDYPLTVSDLSTWLLFQDHVEIPKEIKRKKQFLFFSGRAALVGIREERKRLAQKKWKVAKKAVKLLAIIPTIECIGVTGGLAMDNAKAEDDIDFLFITSSGAMWITRLFAIFIMELSGMRRRPHAKQVTNAICLNMFMTSDAMPLPRREQDAYAAHEVLQMKPLWDRGGAYRKFLLANSWVKRFLPNAWKARTQNPRTNDQQGKQFLLSSGIWVLRFIEPLARMIQLWYMKKHRTTEVIGDTILRFHPLDARVWVKRALSTGLTRYKIPLDKVWYGR